MRRITMLALVAVLALTGAACGGDDDDSGGDETEATDEGGSTDDGATTDDGGDDGATDAAVAAGLLDEDCQFLLAGAYLNPLAALSPGGDGDIEDANEQLQAIADEAPDEIKDAMETLSEGYAAMAEALEGVDLSDPQAFADPELQERFAELEDVFDEEYEAAGQTVSEYIEAECSP
jgi:hypothetical protein